jgi:hypothetical protein
VESTKFVGMDVHKEAITIAVMDSAGKVIMESIIETKAVTILQFIQGLRGEVDVTFEEGTWAAWLYDLLKPHVTKVVVCIRICEGGLRSMSICLVSRSTRLLKIVSQNPAYRSCEFLIQSDSIADCFGRLSSSPTLCSLRRAGWTFVYPHTAGGKGTIIRYGIRRAWSHTRRNDGRHSPRR